MIVPLVLTYPESNRPERAILRERDSSEVGWAVASDRTGLLSPRMVFPATGLIPDYVKYVSGGSRFCNSGR